jgi:hypothetical protein
MDERGLNIDIVFRNGLKDFEVLPPPEVWDNIHPVIKTRHKPFFLLRAAALIAIILTMSYLAFRLSREVISGTGNEVTALNSEAPVSTIPASIEKPAKIIIAMPEPVKSSLSIITEDKETLVVPAEIKTPGMSNLQVSTSMAVKEFHDVPQPLLAGMKSSPDKIFEINEPDNIRFSAPVATPRMTERWSIAAMASPTYYSNFLSGNSEFSQQLSASEQAVISYTGGLSFTFKINKRFSVQSGLYYSSLGQEVTGINSYAGFQVYDNTKGDHNFEVATTSGTIYTNNADVFLMAAGSPERIQTSFTNDVFDPNKARLDYVSSSMHQNFSYLEIPVLIRYKVVDRIVDLNLIGGVSYNLLVNNSVYTIVDGGKYPIGSTRGLNPISLSSSLGMGMEYNLSNKLSLNLEPTFRYYLNPFNEIVSSKNHPYSFGLFSGVSYKF